MLARSARRLLLKNRQGVITNKLAADPDADDVSPGGFTFT
jgi:hypothetical protein